jgi:hypothetical protein
MSPPNVRRRLVVYGLSILLVGALGVVLRFVVAPPASLRYVASGTSFAVMVSLRPTTARAVAPDSITVELPSGERLTAHRLR